MAEAKPAWPVRANLIPWAEVEGGVAAAAGAVELRRTLVERIERDAWIPPTEAQFALETLALGVSRGAELQLGPGEGMFFVAAENRLRREIDAFADEFFSLPTPVRKTRRDELAARCAAFPALQARLKALERALNVVLPGQGPSPRALEVVRNLAALFVAAPMRRVELRQELRSRLDDDPQAWRQAAIEVQRRWPELCEFDRPYMKSLERAGRKVRTRSSLATNVDRTASAMRDAPVSTPREDAYAARRRKRTGLPSFDLSGGGRLLIWFILAGSLGVMRSCDSGRTSNDNYRPDNYKPAAPRIVTPRPSGTPAGALGQTRSRSTRPVTISMPPRPHTGPIIIGAPTKPDGFPRPYDEPIYTNNAPPWQIQPGKPMQLPPTGPPR